MTEPRSPEARIAAFFATVQPDLPDRAFDAVRRDIHGTRQQRGIGWLGQGPAPRWRSRPAFGLAAGAAAIALVVLWSGAWGPWRTGPAGGSSVPSPGASGSPPPPSPLGPSSYASELYGYRVTLPEGWAIRPAIQAWDGRVAPAFGGAETDAYTGPGQLAAMSFARPFDGDLQAFVDDRIAANDRDHAADCPAGSLQLNEPVDVGGEVGVLLGWNCGALIEEALVVRDGVAYAFAFRDLAIKAARDPTDLAIFQSILDSVVFPAASPVSPASSA